MNDVIRTILIMSIAGSVIAALLFALKPIVRNRLPKSVQYYLWMVVVAALLIPISLFIKLPATGNNSSFIAVPDRVVNRYAITSAEERSRETQIQLLLGTTYTDNLNPISTQHLEHVEQVKQMIEVLESEKESPIAQVMDIFLFIYPLGVTAVLLYFMISYVIFIGLYYRHNQAANEAELAILKMLCKHRITPRLYRNSLATTPMLINMFHPTILLPDRNYTDEQLSNVLLHELTHLQRKDILVKWLSVFALAIHWFNPIVWFVRREIDRACELSCDEVIIRNLDMDGRQEYGDTLLYVATEPKTPRGALGTLMCEEKKALKERLGAIMKSKKYTPIAIVLSVVLVVAASGMAITLGSSRGEEIAGIDRSYSPIFDVVSVFAWKDNGQTRLTLYDGEMTSSPSMHSVSVRRVFFDISELNAALAEYEPNTLSMVHVKYANTLFIGIRYRYGCRGSPDTTIDV